MNMLNKTYWISDGEVELEVTHAQLDLRVGQKVWEESWLSPYSPYIATLPPEFKLRMNLSSKSEIIFRNVQQDQSERIKRIKHKLHVGQLTDDPDIDWLIEQLELAQANPKSLSNQ